MTTKGWMLIMSAFAVGNYIAYLTVGRGINLVVAGFIIGVVFSIGMMRRHKHSIERTRNDSKTN